MAAGACVTEMSDGALLAGAVVSALPWWTTDGNCRTMGKQVQINRQACISDHGTGQETGCLHANCSRCRRDAATESSSAGVG